jgi:energy-coupling factor transporter ATP-binding protein EcfA2
MAYRYPDGTEALAGIDLEIAAGDRIALVGQNGSGKTTLVRHLAGLLQPSAGSLAFKGRPLAADHLEASRLAIGVLFQDPDDQLFGHTLLDVAAFGPRNQGHSREAAEEAARQALARVHLLDQAYKPPHSLSFGQKKRAALAGLLALAPEVLLLDEPTANLDPRQEEVFLDLLKGFPGTLVCISHDLLFLYELCDRAVVLDRGRLHHDSALTELVAQRASLREHGLDFSFRLVASEPDGTDASVTADAAPSVPAAAPPGAPLLLTLEDYRFRYPDGTRALDGVHLALGEGERLALVGENGAGKSTLVACLLGLREGTGAFGFEGRPVTRRRRRALWRRVGLVFQDCADQLFGASVGEEVAFGLRRLGCLRREIPRRTEEALDRVGLAGFAERVPLHLSGGERKRLALGAVLAMEPQLLILDEPTAGLDPQGEELLLEILRGLEVTLLLVSHDIFFIRELTQRTVVLHQGRVVADLPTAAFLQAEGLSHLNGLAYTYRAQSHTAIRALQHAHEHRHPHAHLHAHPHRHGGLVHDHPHAHEHDHPHQFVHSHPGDEAPHHHAPRRFHEHDHPGHEGEPHEHDHPES